VESSSSPICLSNLKTNASKGCKQCVQNLQRMSKESCKTTYKQHSKTSIERYHYCEQKKLQNNLGKKFIEVVKKKAIERTTIEKKKDESILINC
jgi:predicted amidophosphoribosyltransferase